MEKGRKNIVQDVIPSEERTIRRIPVRPAETPVRMSRVRAIPPPARLPVRRSRFSGIVVSFLVVFFGIAVIAVALSLLYSKASVTITPKTANFDVKGTFTAKKEPGYPLAYDVTTSSETAQQTINAADGPLIQTKAKGTVYLYNEQKVPQKIVAGTRLSNASGKIYRTTSTVTIPAMGSARGAISVGVIADQAGAQYNMSLNDTDISFKVVAYKGGEKYSVVYGKLKTAVSGGFSGSKKVISPAAQSAAVESLKESLKTKLVSRAKEQVPKDHIFYDNAYTIEYDIPEPAASDKNTAVILVKGTINAVTFKKDALLKAVAGKELDKFAAPTYRVDMMEDLSFFIINAKDFSPKKGIPLIFSLKGPITIVGTFSEAALKNELKGTYLKQSNAIFSRYPAIANAYALITPFWMRSFPNSPEKISIEIKD